MTSKKLKLEEFIKKSELFIEKHRFYVGSGLIVLILAGAGILLWRENFAKQNSESRIANLESRINQLENEYDKYQVSSIKYQAGEQDSQRSSADQGQVAGASSQNAVGQNTDNSKKTTANSQPVFGKININTASVTELDSLSGIGPTYAKRIVEYRNVNGGFKSIDEIKNVKGIGDKTFLKFKDQIGI